MNTAALRHLNRSALMHELDGLPAWLCRVLRWITETTRASRLARLSTLGLQIPRDSAPQAERWLHER